MKQIKRNYRVKQIIHGIAHITGGGLIDNPPRLLPEGLAIALTRGSWTIPPVFPWLQSIGSVPDAEDVPRVQHGDWNGDDRGELLRRVDHPPSQVQREGSGLDHRRSGRREPGGRLGVTGVMAEGSAADPSRTDHGFEERKEPDVFHDRLPAVPVGLGITRRPGDGDRVGHVERMVGPVGHV